MDRWKGRVAPKKAFQKFDALMQFESAFLKDGTFWCSSGYECLAATVKGKEGDEPELTPITAEFAGDARVVADLLDGILREEMIENPRVWYLWSSGANSNATSSANASKRGWGPSWREQCSGPRREVHDLPRSSL